ncbi:MAG: cation transporter [Melioribacteraceae bacterium]|nr:cation transporter [Melioribacteraceae bacterium]
MQEIIFHVDGMTCNHCVMAVKKELSKLNLENYDVVIGTVKVKFDELKCSKSEIEKAIEEAGYKVLR